MRFRSASIFIASVLFIALFLTPLYSVHAQLRSNAATRSANPKLLEDIAKQKERLEMTKVKFDDRISQMKSRIASREAEFKLRVEKFTDRVKADLATKVNQTLNRINQNQTQQMNNNLNRMNQILDRVVTRVSGTASQSAQVVAAKSALETAHTSVEVQAGKDYTVNVSTESAIRKDAQSARTKLQTDLRATREVVKSAKTAVSIAIRSLLGGGVSTPSASASATPAATQSGVPAR